MGAHCDTRRQNTSPVAMPRTPPFGLRSGVKRARARAGATFAGFCRYSGIRQLLCCKGKARRSRAGTSINTILTFWRPRRAACERSPAMHFLSARVGHRRRCCAPCTSERLRLREINVAANSPANVAAVARSSSPMSRRGPRTPQSRAKNERDKLAGPCGAPLRAHQTGCPTSSTFTIRARIAT